MGTGISIPLPLDGYGVSELSQLINYYLARERKFQGAKVLGTFAPGSESSRERKFLGAKVLGTFAPAIESSIPWYFRSRERKFLGAKVPVTPQTSRAVEWRGAGVMLKNADDDN